MNKLIGTTAFAVFAVGAVGVAAPAQAAKVNFGSALNSSVQPSNSPPGIPCDPVDLSASCTYVQNEAYGRPDGGEKAPRSGILKRIRVISGDTTTFSVQLVKVNAAGQARLKKQGPTFQAIGQTPENWNSGVYKVESFKVNMDIKKGWRLAMVTNTHNPAARCSSGGPNTLIYKPALWGSGFTSQFNDDGCWELIEGVIK